MCDTQQRYPSLHNERLLKHEKKKIHGLKEDYYLNSFCCFRIVDILR